MSAFKKFIAYSTMATLSNIAISKDIPLTYRTDINSYIQQVSHRYHIPPQELTSIFNRVKLQPQIIEAIERPYEAKPWPQYRGVFLTPERTAAGVKFWRTHAKDLARAEKQYGVPANIIVAILGVETYYGQRQGNYRVIDALSTLAFNYPSRAPFFRNELTEYLLLTREHKLDPFSLMGSYAGAIGQPQFMPSSYRHYAVDFSGHGRSDLRNNTTDVIGSVANYFKQHGWQYQAPVIQPATILGNHPRQLDTSARVPNYSLAQLSHLGIKPKHHAPNAHKVGVVVLEDRGGAPLWIAYPNFYVITRYNTSKQYAMAVYELSEAIKTQLAETERHHAVS